MLQATAPVGADVDSTQATFLDQMAGLGRNARAKAWEAAMEEEPERSIAAMLRVLRDRWPGRAFKFHRGVWSTRGDCPACNCPRTLHAGDPFTLMEQLEGLS